MSADFRTPNGALTPETEGAKFAPTPLWARDTKTRRGRRSPRPNASDPAMDLSKTGAGVIAEPTGAVYEPIRTESRRRGLRPAAALGALVAVAALGAVGWYASRPQDSGLAQLTPGAPVQAGLDTAPPPSAGQSPAATQPNGNTAAETASTTAGRETSAGSGASMPPATHRTRALAARTPAPRVRPAANSTAMDTAVNASATAPVVSLPAPSPLAPAPATSTAAPPSNEAPTTAGDVTSSPGPTAAPPMQTTIP